MSLYNELLKFEESCSWISDSILDIAHPMYHVYLINVHGMRRRLNSIKVYLSFTEHEMDEEAFKDALICIYEMTCIYKKCGIDIPKIEYPPLIQEYVKIREVMDS